MPQPRFHRPAAMLCIISLLSAPVAATAQNQVSDAVREHISADRMVHFTTGINPQDYPCARAGIINLYEKREALGDMSRFHPKRIFAWVLDTSSYYLYRFMDFLKGLMNPDAVMRGVNRVKHMARGGNPLAGMDRKVEGWVSNISPKNKFVLERKVQQLIEKTTNADGSCKN